MSDINHYKATELFLYNYNSLKASIKNIWQELEEIDYREISAVDLQYEPVATNAIHQPTEEAAVRVADLKTHLEQRIKITESKLERIDRAIEALNPTERQIIEQRYKNGKQWWEIAYEVKFNERWCKEIRRRAVNKIAIGLFGENAMPESCTNTAFGNQ